MPRESESFVHLTHLFYQYLKNLISYKPRPGANELLQNMADITIWSIR